MERSDIGVLFPIIGVFFSIVGVPFPMQCSSAIAKHPETKRSPRDEGKDGFVGLRLLVAPGDSARDDAGSAAIMTSQW